MPTPGERFDELVRIMATLRGPEGCPWDREQTLARSVRSFSKRHEALEALDRGDLDSLREELGDLLFEIVFLARIAEEGGHFSVADAAADVGAKLVRRHPHVFGDHARLKTAEEGRGKWEEIKAAERGEGAREAEGGKTLLGGVPRTLPALLRAYEYGSRAAAVGFDWVRAPTSSARSRRRFGSCATSCRSRRPARQSERGAWRRKWAICCSRSPTCRASWCRARGRLRRANDKFQARFTALESRVVSRGERLQDKTLKSSRTSGSW
jgi:MazG family protein